jgi:hypothetical protein
MGNIFKRKLFSFGIMAKNKKFINFLSEKKIYIFYIFNIINKKKKINKSFNQVKSNISERSKTT